MATLPHAPRLKPLAFCLALAFGIGSATAQQQSSRGPESQLPEALVSTRDGQRSPERPRADAPALHSPPESFRAMAPGRPAGVQTVSNCDDDGPGSLRNAVEFAVSGDIIDLGDLTCSAISLDSGALITGAEDLTILGPDDGEFGLLASVEGRLIQHVGSGELELANLIMAYAVNVVTDGDANGGCVYSSGRVSLTNSSIYFCSVEATGGDVARGGAVFATHGVDLFESHLRGNAAIADSAAGGAGLGGAVFSGGAATIHDSEMIGNLASDSGGSLFVEGNLTVGYSAFRHSEATTGFGGGIAVRDASVSISHSTISDNSATHAGGLDIVIGDLDDSAVIRNSTIANNEGTDTRYGGGIYSGVNLELESCTISGNIERHDQSEKYGGGVGIGPGRTLQMRNTIISGNQRYTLEGEAPLPSDLRALGAQELVVGGEGNIVAAAFNAMLPPDTLELPPGLGPLRDNGGPTHTMMPLEGSAALDAAPSSDLSYDQRGVGFARQIGPAVDIGAIELDLRLFADGFEQ